MQQLTTDYVKTVCNFNVYLNWIQYVIFTYLGFVRDLYEEMLNNKYLPPPMLSLLFSIS